MDVTCHHGVCFSGYGGGGGMGAGGGSMVGEVIVVCVGGGTN